MVAMGSANPHWLFRGESERGGLVTHETDPVQGEKGITLEYIEVSQQIDLG